MITKLVFITDNCKNDAQRYNFPLQKAAERIITGNPGIERFEGGYYVWKKYKGWDNRLIILKYITANPLNEGGDRVEVNIFMRLLLRKSGDYNAFCDGNLSQKNTIAKRSDLDWEEIDRFIKESLTRPVDNFIELRQELSDDEYSYIYDTKIAIGSLEDQMVYESKEWVELIRQQNYNHDLTSICKTLDDFFNNVGHEEQYDEDILNNEIIETFVPIPQTKWSVLIYTLPGNDGWYLGSIDTKERLEAMKKDAFGFMYSDVCPSQETIIQKTRRVYPSIYLAEDSTFWNEMEIDPWGNYALSGEELKILRPEGENQQNSITFPLFINGRAGSGKSTILQYLFTEFFVSGLEKNIAPSLYLSYSKDLIDYAIKMVRSLIIRNIDRKNYVAQILDSRYDDDDIEQTITPEVSDNQQKRTEDERFINKLSKSFSESFYSFQDLLFSLIPPKFKKRFPSDKYWSFTDFKQEWNRSFSAQKKYSASICWHIIRTYIKGWFDDEYCTPEYFNDLGVDSVSKETFQWVYTNVWEKWYKKRYMDEKGVWDDQDLVRFCLNPSSCYDFDDEETKELPETFIEPRFSGIFCDESQDFTQVELAAIIGLSIFSNRKITSPLDLEKIPFVFAGDEFQTLNPTGFSWSSLRKTFTERLIYKINPRLKGADKPFELQNNYRSSRSIVRFSNRIQLLRRILFEKEIGKDIAPQNPWDMTDNTPVLCFSPIDSSVWYKLKEAKAVVIVPCEEGQSKEDYVNSAYEGKLSGLITFDDNGASNDITLLTPAQAKGMEYPIVAICGFDNSEVTKVIDKLLVRNCPDITDTQNIEYKYWINNVYVSITRAKKQLIILDPIFDYSAEHRNNFWKYSYQDSNHPENKDYTNSLLELLSQNERKDKWKNADETLGYMYRSTVDKINSANSRQDSVDNADALYEDGKLKRDASKLAQAARIYQEVGGDNKKLHMSYGYMHLFNRDFDNAYKEFKLIGENKLAIESLWLKLDNHSIIQDPPIIPDWKNTSVCKILKLPENSAVDTTEKDFADLLNSECDSTFLSRFSDAILRLSKEFKDNSRIHFLSVSTNSDIWGAVVNTIISMLLKAINKTKNPKKLKVDDLQDVFNRLKNLIDFNIAVDTGGLADIAYNIALKSNKQEFHKQCVELWETKEIKERKKNYYLSRSYLDPPEEWFNFLGENSRWESNEQLSKELFSALRDKRKEITDFDKLKDPAKRLYTETYFNQGEEEIGFKEYAARIKNAAEYEKLISTVKEKNQNSALFCQRLKTITMIKSYIENWIDKPETKDSDVLKKKSAALIKNIETYFENTSWIKPLRTMLELCDLDMVNKLDAASYKKQSKKFCEDNLTYLTKFDQTFIPIVMNVAGCVIEKSERFISRVMFYEWARDWAKDENNKNNDYSKLIPWFDKRRAVAKYKIAEYDGNKDEIVLATKELERCDVVPKTDDDGDDVEYPDLSYLYNRLIRMDVDGKIQAPKNPPRRKKSSREIRREEKQRNSSRDDARNRRSHLKPAEPIAPAPDSDDLSTNTTIAVPEKTSEDVKDSIVPAETVESVPVVSVEPPVPVIAESAAEQPKTDQESVSTEAPNDIAASTSAAAESDDSHSDAVSSDSSDKQESETVTSEDIGSTDDGDSLHDNSEDTTPVISESASIEPVPQAKRFKAQFRMLTSCSQLTVTLDLIENGVPVNSYTGKFLYDTGDFLKSELGLVDNRIVLPDGTRTPYTIIKKSKNEFIIEED